jgi:hypothetical protein
VLPPRRHRRCRALLVRACLQLSLPLLLVLMLVLLAHAVWLRAARATHLW